MRIAESWRRLRLLLRRDRATAELEQEMRLHRELRAESLRASGATATEAVTAARRHFGNSVGLTETSRDMWGLGSLDDLGQDIRYAARRLRQRPGFTVSIIAVLALGIGATTAMFSVVVGAMLRPLPFAQPDRIVVLHDIRMPNHSGPRPPEHVPDLLDIVAMRQTFSHAAGFASGGLINVTRRAGIQPAAAAAASSTPIDTMNATPLCGGVSYRSGPRNRPAHQGQCPQRTMPSASLVLRTGRRTSEPSPVRC